MLVSEDMISYEENLAIKKSCDLVQKYQYINVLDSLP